MSHQASQSSQIPTASKPVLKRTYGKSGLGNALSKGIKKAPSQQQDTARPVNKSSRPLPWNGDWSTWYYKLEQTRTGSDVLWSPQDLEQKLVETSQDVPKSLAWNDSVLCHVAAIGSFESTLLAKDLNSIWRTHPSQIASLNGVSKARTLSATLANIKVMMSFMDKVQIYSSWCSFTERFTLRMLAIYAEDMTSLVIQDRDEDLTVHSRSTTNQSRNPEGEALSRITSSMVQDSEVPVDFERCRNLLMKRIRRGRIWKMLTDKSKLGVGILALFPTGDHTRFDLTNKYFQELSKERAEYIIEEMMKSKGQYLKTVCKLLNKYLVTACEGNFDASLPVLSLELQTKDTMSRIVDLSPDAVKLFKELE